MAVLFILASKTGFATPFSLLFWLWLACNSYELFWKQFKVSFMMPNAKKLSESVVPSQVHNEAKWCHKSIPSTFAVQVWVSPNPCLQSYQKFLHDNKIESILRNCRSFVRSYWKNAQKADAFWKQHSSVVAFVMIVLHIWTRPNIWCTNLGEPKTYTWEQVNGVCAISKRKVFSACH